MMRSLNKQQPLPTPEKHREPPSLWLFAIAASTGLHSLLLWFLFASQFTLITKQADNSFTPIEIIEIPPSPQTSPDIPKPAPQAKLPLETTSPKTNTNPDTDGEIALRNNDRNSNAIALQQKQQLEQQRQQQLEQQQRQQQLEQQQRQQQLEQQQRQQKLEQQQRQQQLEQQQRQQQLEQQQRQQQLEQQRQQKLEQQQRQQQLEQQQRQQQLEQQQRQQQLEQQQRQREQERHEREKIGNLPGLETGNTVDVDKNPIKPPPGNSDNAGGLVAINISVFPKPEQDQRVRRDLPHIYARPKGNLPNTLPMLDGYAIAQRVECEVLLLIDDSGNITGSGDNKGIQADLSNPQRNLCQRYAEAYFENVTFEPAQDESGKKPPLSQLYVKIVIEPNPAN